MIELLTGEPIFPGRSEAEMVGGIIDCLGMKGVGVCVAEATTRPVSGRSSESKRDKVKQWFLSTKPKPKPKPKTDDDSYLECDDSSSDSERVTSEDDMDPITQTIRVSEQQEDSYWKCVAPRPSRSRQNLKSSAWGGKERDLWMIIKRRMEETNRSNQFLSTLEDSGVALNSSTEIFGEIDENPPLMRSCGTMTGECGVIVESICPAYSLDHPGLDQEMRDAKDLETPGQTASDFKHFYLLIRRMLAFNQNDRISPEDAVHSSFFTPKVNSMCQTHGDWLAN